MMEKGGDHPKSPRSGMNRELRQAISLRISKIYTFFDQISVPLNRRPKLGQPPAPAKERSQGRGAFSMPRPPQARSRRDSQPVPGLSVPPMGFFADRVRGRGGLREGPLLSKSVSSRPARRRVADAPETMQRPGPPGTASHQGGRFLAVAIRERALSKRKNEDEQATQSVDRNQSNRGCE